MHTPEQSLLTLNDDLLLAKGGERLCYLHPDDSTKVIKIAPTDGVHRNQNSLEHHYYHYLHSSNKDLRYITQCFGYVDTNLGSGLVFARALNYDGTPAISLEDFIAKHILSTDAHRQLLSVLLQYLSKNQIMFGDIGCCNIFCKEIAKERYELVIVDGLGGRRFNYKYWLYLKISFYRRYKIMKQAKKMQVDQEHVLSKNGYE